jgi:hypothetical protein
MPAGNGRFGSMAALPPLENVCRNASFAPVRAAVEAPLEPSRQHVSGNFVDSAKAINRKS